MMTKFHHYFFLSINPWPLNSSLCAFNLMFSLLLFFKFKYMFSFIFGILILIFISFIWWLNYKKEFDFNGLSSLDLEFGLKTAMILFISSEVFFFFSFFWAYFHFLLSPMLENGFEWPPMGILSFDAINVPFLNTLILLSSGGFVTMSHFYLNSKLFKMSNLTLFLTILFGILFTLCQIQEYFSSFFSISDGNFGSSFFMLTGFHGIHVLIGTMFLMSVFLASLINKSSLKNFLMFELACWYWHFVDVVWIFLFFFLYYLN